MFQKIKQTVNTTAETHKIPPWTIWLDIILRVLLFTSAFVQIFFGETAIGILTLICLLVITLPNVFTRKIIPYIPIEIEILLLVMVLIQFVIGEARDFYTTVPYYDKFVHLMLPMFMGVIGFMIFYTMYRTGKLYTTTRIMMVLVFFLTLGIGAAWEIVEYSSDQIIYPRVEGWHKFQGSLTEDPLHDTMNDLIADAAGGILGIVLALRYVTWANVHGKKRLDQLVKELGRDDAIPPSSLESSTKITHKSTSNVKVAG